MSRRDSRSVWTSWERIALRLQDACLRSAE